MFIDRFQLVRQSFADQFEAEGNGYVYRRDQRGPAIRISAQERREFIDAFNRVIRLGFWCIVFGTILIIIGMVFVFPQTIDHPWITYLAFIVLMAITVGGQMWARYAPSRVLRDRIPSRSALSKSESRTRFMRKLSYSQLGIGVVTALFMLWSASRRRDVLHGWGLLWTIAAVALLVLVAVQTFRKWRFDLEDQSQGEQDSIDR